MNCLCLQILGNIGSLLGGIFAIIAFTFARETYKKDVEQNRIRETLGQFPLLRERYWELTLQIKKVPEDEEQLRKQTNLLKKYLSDMEKFAVGINMEAYDLATVNRMSGGLLVRQYKSYIKSFIKVRRKKYHSEVQNEKVYIEYEEMMKKLFEMRGEKWEE